jgi:hypothetical protein
MRKAKNAKLIVPPDDFYKHRQSIYDPIARGAYERFESRGSVHGHHEDDWYQAESELLQPVTFELSDSGDAFIVVSNVTGYRPEDLRVSVELRSLRICGQALAAFRGAFPFLRFACFHRYVPSFSRDHQPQYTRGAPTKDAPPGGLRVRIETRLETLRTIFSIRRWEPYPHAIQKDDHDSNCLMMSTKEALCGSFRF